MWHYRAIVSGDSFWNESPVSAFKFSAAGKSSGVAFLLFIVNKLHYFVMSYGRMLRQDGFTPLFLLLWNKPPYVLRLNLRHSRFLSPLFISVCSTAAGHKVTLHQGKVSLLALLWFYSQFYKNGKPIPSSLAIKHAAYEAATFDGFALKTGLSSLGKSSTESLINAQKNEFWWTQILNG